MRNTLVIKSKMAMTRRTSCESRLWTKTNNSALTGTVPCYISASCFSVIWLWYGQGYPRESISWYSVFIFHWVMWVFLHFIALTFNDVNILGHVTWPKCLRYQSCLIRKMVQGILYSHISDTMYRPQTKKNEKWEIVKSSMFSDIR